MFIQFLRLDGKAFHTVGPVWKKARSPKVFRVTLGITSNVSESDRRLYPVLGFTTSSWDKYCLCCKQGKHYRGAFDWSYCRIRIRKHLVTYLFYRDFWTIWTLHTSEYFISSKFLGIAMLWIPKQAIFRFHSTYFYSRVLSIEHALCCPLIPDNDSRNNRLHLW